MSDCSVFGSGAEPQAGSQIDKATHAKDLHHLHKGVLLLQSPRGWADTTLGPTHSEGLKFNYPEIQPWERVRFRDLFLTLRGLALWEGWP